MMNNRDLPPVFAGGIEDLRKRRYIPPAGIVWQEGEIHDSCHLLNDPCIQSYAYDNMPVCRLAPGSSIVLDFGCELPGGVRIVTSPNRLQISRVKVTFGESVSEALGEPDNDHAMHQTMLWLPPTGMTEYGNTGFRFVRLQVPQDAAGKLELISVFAAVILRDLEYAGKFHSSDARLNRIWQTGAYTVHVNMQDYLYDGIKRDRMVWLGDVYPEARTVMSVFNDTDCVEKTLAFVPEHTPAGEWFNGTSSYAAWWVICHWEWFWRRGRMEFLRSAADRLRTTLHTLAECVDSCGSEHLPETRFLDWPSRDDAAATHAGLQGLLSWCFLCGSRLAAVLQDSELESFCTKIREKLLKASVPVTENKSAAAMLVLGGYHFPADWHCNALKVEPDRRISTFFGYFVLEAMAAMNTPETALQIIRSYWGGMLDMGATTFWEDFDLEWIKNASPIDRVPVAGKNDIHRDFGKHCYKGLRHSLCHGWASGPTAFLSEHILGITCAAPGFSRIFIAPEAAGLEYVCGSVPTPFGTVDIEGDGKKWQCRVPGAIEVAGTAGDNIEIRKY